MSLVDRARRLRRKGESRKALVALREACLRDEENAAIWTLYGALLARAGKLDEARRALVHAHWLRKTCGDEPRMRVTARLIDELCVLHAA
jgi:Flp pilus assembly protein TadD